MTTEAINRQKLSNDIHTRFPRRRKPQDEADALIAADTLGAISYGTRTTKFKLTLQGTTDNGVIAAYEDGLFERQKSSGKSRLRSDRGPVPKDDVGVLAMLNWERKHLYNHIMADRRVKKVVLDHLQLEPEKVMEAIRAAMENGELPKQISTYDKVVRAIVAAKMFSRANGYLWMGFMKPPHEYWLSDLGKDLLRQASA